MFSIFSSPARYTQGMNATQIHGKEMAGPSIQGPALIVAGRSALAQLSDTWKQTLGEAGCSYGIHGFRGECSLAEIMRIDRRSGDRGAIGSDQASTLNVFSNQFWKWCLLSLN